MGSFFERLLDGPPAAVADPEFGAPLTCCEDAAFAPAYGKSRGRRSGGYRCTSCGKVWQSRARDGRWEVCGQGESGA